MNRFTDSIRQSIQEKNWFAAIFLGLAMPDVCGGLETPTVGNGERYKRWFNNNLKQKYDIENQWEFRLFHSPDIAEIMLSEPRYASYIEELKAKECERANRFTAEDCYAFRNACLHAGMAGAQRRNIKLTPPLETGGVVNKCVINGILQIQIDVFCEDICLAVDEWADKNKNDADIKDRISKLIEVSHITVGGLRVF